MTAYLHFILAHRGLLAFGLIAAACSSFGQTFFIGFFNTPLRTAFELSHSEFAAIYTLATLGSGLLIIWLGRFVDSLPLKTCTLAVAVGLAVAAGVLASAQTVWMLGLALLLLRVFGQGLMAHVAITSMARYFTVARGKAVSIAALGFPLGEAVLPLGLVLVGAYLGWRETWWLVAGAILLLALPGLLLLLRPQQQREAGLQQQLAAAEERGERQWAHDEVLRDPRFYALLPAVLAGPFIITALFFHQLYIVQAQGWATGVLVTAMAGFAATRLVVSLAAGALVDRHGPSIMLPLLQLPLLFGLVVLWVSTHPLAGWLAWMLVGAAVGASTPVTTALWTGLYGIRHIGAIRSLSHAAMIFATAVSPLAVALLIERGWPLAEILAAGVAYVCAAGVLAAAVLLRAC